MIRSFFLLLLFAACAVPARGQGESGEPHPREDRFFAVVLSDEERAAYEFLADDRKAAFRRKHWGRLDPTPASEENEREMEHQRRVVEAIDRFRDRSGRFVWDDRAKAWIRFGRPAGIEFLRGALEGDTFVPPREAWRYDGALFWFEDRELSGAYRFGDGEGALPATADTRRRVETGEGFAWDVMGEEDPAAARARALAAFSLDSTGVGIRTREGLEWWERVPERNEHASPPSELVLEPSVSVFGRPDSLSSVLIGVGIPAGPLGRAREVDSGRSSMRIEMRTALRDSTFSVAATGRKEIILDVAPGVEPPLRLVAVDSLVSEPGPYRLAIAVEDLAGGGGGVFEADIDVPDFTDGSMRMSDLLFAEKATTDFRQKGPVRRGDYRIDPRPDRAFRKGERVYVYFELHGVKPDRDGRFYTEIVFSLSSESGAPFSARFGGTEKGRLSEGSAAEIGNVSRASSSVHAIAIETSGLSPGAYALVIEARDLSSGEQARGAGRFIMQE
ncbi:MAG: GWxTD domain-containing protein [Candidatus Eisenbacteria bacterium]|nr:GWxTD domain-containing protein [Candidatus Eisenbacteria bacterium]